MKNIFVVILFTLLYGCNGGGGIGGGSESTQESPKSFYVWDIPDTRSPDTGFLPGYSSWLSREYPHGYTLNNDGYIDATSAENIADQIFHELTWGECNLGKWQTSVETDTSKVGNCADMSIMIYVSWRNSGFSDDKIGMLHLEKVTDGVKYAHMVPCIFVDGVIRTFDLSDRTSWTPVQVFNIGHCWKLR